MSDMDKPKPIMKINKLKKDNALIIYDCCKPHDKTNTQIELLIIFHKDCLIAEVVARQFDQVIDEDFRIYLNYLEMYKRIELLIYTKYVTDLAQKVIDFGLANPQLPLPTELSTITPFAEYHCDVAKDNIVNFVLERLKVNVKHHHKNEEKNNNNKPNIRLDFFHDPLGTANNTVSDLVCEQPEGFKRYDIKHHRQNSIGATLFKELLAEAELEGPEASPPGDSQQRVEYTGHEPSAPTHSTDINTLHAAHTPRPGGALPPVVGSGRPDVHRMESDFLQLMKTHRQGGGGSEKINNNVKPKHKTVAGGSPVLNEQIATTQNKQQNATQPAQTQSQQSILDANTALNGIAHTNADGSHHKNHLPVISPRPVFSGRYSSNLSPQGQQFSHTNFDMSNTNDQHSPNNLVMLPKLSPQSGAESRDSIFLLKNTVNSRPSSSNSNVKLRPLDDAANKGVRRDRSDSEGSNTSSSGKAHNHVNFNLNYGSVKLEAIYNANSSFMNAATSQDNTNPPSNNITVSIPKSDASPSDFSHLSSSVKMMTSTLLNKTNNVMNSLKVPLSRTTSPVDLDGLGQTMALLGMEKEGGADEIMTSGGSAKFSIQSVPQSPSLKKPKTLTPEVSAKATRSVSQSSDTSQSNGSVLLRASFADALSLEVLIEKHADDLLHHSRLVNAGSQDDYDDFHPHNADSGKGDLFKSTYTPTSAGGPSWGAGITSTRSSIQFEEPILPTGNIITEDIAEKIKHTLETHQVTGFQQNTLKIDTVGPSKQLSSKANKSQNYSIPGDENLRRTPKELYYKASDKPHAVDDSECVTPSKRMAGNTSRSFGDTSPNSLNDFNTITSRDTENLLSSSAKVTQSLAASAAQALQSSFLAASTVQAQGTVNAANVQLLSSSLQSGQPLTGSSAATPTSTSSVGLKAKKTRRRSIGDTPVKTPSSFGSNNSQVNPRGGNLDVKEKEGASGRAVPKTRRRSYGEEPPSIVPEGLSVRKPKVVAGDGSAQSAAQSATDKLFGGSSSTKNGMAIVDKAVVFVDDYSPVSRMGIL